MKIICETASFTAVCLSVQRVIPNKGVLPHFESLMFETQGSDSVRITGSDLDIGIYKSAAVQVLEGGAAVINARLLCDILKLVPEDTVTLTCDDKNICTVVSGKAEYSLVGLKPEEYPPFPEIEGAVGLKIGKGVLKDMFRRTLYAVSQDLSKKVHCGIKFEVKPGELRLVALDGYRMAIRNEFLDYSGKPFEFIVPSKTVGELIRLAESDDGFFDLTVGIRHIAFEFEGYYLYSKLLMGDFLNYHSAIPPERRTVARIKTKTLIDCVERVSVVITEKIRSPLKCVFDSDLLHISTVTALGGSEDEIDISIDGESTQIGFNNRFLLDALRNCDADELLIVLNGPVSPVLLLPLEGEEFIYMILPIRLNG